MCQSVVMLFSTTYFYYHGLKMNCFIIINFYAVLPFTCDKSVWQSLDIILEHFCEKIYQECAEFVSFLQIVCDLEGYQMSDFIS